jgi:hypothetical protein
LTVYPSSVKNNKILTDSKISVKKLGIVPLLYALNPFQRRQCLLILLSNSLSGLATDLVIISTTPVFDYS